MSDVTVTLTADEWRDVSVALSLTVEQQRKQGRINTAWHFDRLLGKVDEQRLTAQETE